MSGVTNDGSCYDFGTTCYGQAGECSCSPTYSGLKCDECISGYYKLGNLCTGMKMTKLNTTFETKPNLLHFQHVPVIQMAFLVVLNVLTALESALVQQAKATVEHNVTHVVLATTNQEQHALVKQNIHFDRVFF